MSGLTNASPLEFNLLKMNGASALEGDLELIAEGDVRTTTSEQDDVSLLTEVLSLAILFGALGTAVLIVTSLKLLLMLVAIAKPPLDKL